MEQRADVVLTSMEARCADREMRDSRSRTCMRASRRAAPASLAASAVSSCRTWGRRMVMHLQNGTTSGTNNQQITGTATLSPLRTPKSI